MESWLSKGLGPLNILFWGPRVGVDVDVDVDVHVDVDVNVDVVVDVVVDVSVDVNVDVGVEFDDVKKLFGGHGLGLLRKVDVNKFF